MLSLIEDVTSTGLSVVAIALPVLALLLVVALFAAAWTAIRRLRRRLASRRETAAAAGARVAPRRSVVGGLQHLVRRRGSPSPRR